MVAAVPSLMLTYGSDITLFGFSSTSQQFFMLGSGANVKLEALGGSETVSPLLFTINNLLVTSNLINVSK